MTSAPHHRKPSVAEKDYFQRRIFREASKRVDERLETIHLWTLKEGLKAEAEERQRRLNSEDRPRARLTAEELAIRECMLDLVRYMRREEKAAERKFMALPKTKVKGIKSMLSPAHKAKRQRLKGLELIAVARVHQAIDIEGVDKEAFDDEICQERRRLWHWGIRDGPKFEIIDMMLQILDGKHEVQEHYLHDWATARLSRGLAGVNGDEKKLEEAYEQRLDKLRFKKREDGEEFAMLSIMLSMIKEARAREGETEPCNIGGKLMPNLYFT